MKKCVPKNEKQGSFWNTGSYNNNEYLQQKYQGIFPTRITILKSQDSWTSVQQMLKLYYRQTLLNFNFALKLTKIN